MKNSPETLKKRREKRRYHLSLLDRNTVSKTIGRVCVVCNETKDCKWDRGVDASGNPTYRNRCIDCHNSYARELRKKDGVGRRRDAGAIRRRRERKKRCVDYLGGKCCICGYNKTVKALTFHHTNPSTKVLAIARSLDYSWDTLQRELNECVLLCMNCHMEVEDEILNRATPSGERRAVNRQRKRKYVEYLGGECSLCGYDKSYRALTFHHMDKLTKSFNISQAIEWSSNRIENELKKCKLLCMNCHMYLEEIEDNDRMVE